MQWSIYYYPPLPRHRNTSISCRQHWYRFEDVPSILFVTKSAPPCTRLPVLLHSGGGGPLTVFWFPVETVLCGGDIQLLWQVTLSESDWPSIHPPRFTFSLASDFTCSRETSFLLPPRLTRHVRSLDLAAVHILVGYCNICRCCKNGRKPYRKFIFWH